MSRAHALILERLERAGIPFVEHAHPELRTVEDIRTHLPFPPGHIVKTLAFRVGPRWVLLAVRGPDRVDYAKIARALEVRRADLVLADALEVEAELGFQAGGVAPFAVEGAELCADEAVWALERTYTGMGRRDRTLELAVSDYLALESPRKVAVTKD